MIDKSGIPLAIFRKLKAAAIDRPFIEAAGKKKEDLRREISDQLSRFKDSSVRGISTLIFPEGTTWGYGGLKKSTAPCIRFWKTPFRAPAGKCISCPSTLRWIVL